MILESYDDKVMEPIRWRLFYHFTDLDALPTPPHLTFGFFTWDQSHIEIYPI